MCWHRSTCLPSRDTRHLPPHNLEDTLPRLSSSSLWPARGTKSQRALPAECRHAGPQVTAGWKGISVFSKMVFTVPSSSSVFSGMTVQVNWRLIFFFFPMDALCCPLISLQRVGYFWEDFLQLTCRLPGQWTGLIHWGWLLLDLPCLLVFLSHAYTMFP